MIGTTYGDIVSLGAVDGDILWRYSADGEIRDIVAMAAANNTTLVAITADGRLLSLPTTGDADLIVWPQFRGNAQRQGTLNP